MFSDTDHSNQTKEAVMFKGTFRRIFGAFPAALTLLGLVVLLQGCGDSRRSPLNSQVGELSQVEASRAVVEAPPAIDNRPSYVVFSPFRATKLVKHANGVISKDTKKTIDGKKGGKLDVKFSDDDDDDDDDDDKKKSVTVRVKKATFKVKAKSFEKKAEISMTVYSGSTLADVKVEFTPSGLSFDPAAGLELQLKGTMKPGKMTGYHVSADGTVTLVEAVVEKAKGGWKLKMDIPGFSEYSWDE